MKTAQQIQAPDNPRSPTESSAVGRSAHGYWDPLGRLTRKQLIRQVEPDHLAQSSFQTDHPQKTKRRCRFRSPSFDVYAEVGGICKCMTAGGFRNEEPF